MKIFQFSILTTLFFFAILPFGNAQISINTDNSSPDASAMLDIKSTDKGLLIPRMTTGQRTGISSPAEGLLVFDSTTNSFWFHDGTAWTELIAGSIKTLADADNDTKIQVEEAADEDIIRFDLAGSERIVWKQNANGNTMIEFPNGGGANLFMGNNTGLNNTGTLNTFVGNAAGEDNTTGGFNAFFGRQAGNKNTTGISNTFVGNAAGSNSITGGFNTYVGQATGRNNATGENNVMIGSNTGQDVTGGSDNVYLGASAGANCTTGNRNVFIGFGAGFNETGSQKLYIDNTGTANPLIYGEFDNHLVRLNGEVEIRDSDPDLTFDSGIFTSKIVNNIIDLDPLDNDMEFHVSGTKVVTLGGDKIANFTGTIGAGNITIGSESTSQGNSNAAGLGFTTTPWLYSYAIEAPNERGANSTLITLSADGVYSTEDDQINLVTSGNAQLTVVADGKIGLDKSAPATDLHIRQSIETIGMGGTGGITFEESADANDIWRIYHSGIFFSFDTEDGRVSYIQGGDGAYVQESDIRVKKNVEEMPSLLDKVMQMRPVTYHYKRQEDSDKKVLGFIAQEVQPLFPEMVSTGENGTLGIAYSNAGIIAIKAIQEQQAELETLQVENADLKKRLERLEAVILKD